jgi:hypothetical protein
MTVTVLGGEFNAPPRHQIEASGPGPLVGCAQGSPKGEWTRRSRHRTAP